MEIVKIENLSFTYPHESNAALNNITLTINNGEFVTVCGKSGCGKTTLLRQLKPAVVPHGDKNGRIYFDGKDIETLDPKEQAQKIGFVLQNPDSQIVTDKVWHELAFGLESLSYSVAEIRNRVAEMASFFGIGDWFHKKVTELSGGQKQLLNLASVMVMQPTLLILDEPTSQLDPISAQNFLDILHKINRELGVTVIISEHRLEDVFPVSDRIIVMDNGRITASGTPQMVGSVLAEKNDDMFLALPTPMRVYYSKENGMPCPITIREGRQWLSNMPIQENTQYVPNPKTVKPYIIELSDVWFRYEKSLPDILKGISLSVKEGEFYAILGENGSGKTTALSVIAGMEKQYRGKVKIANERRIAILPQNPQSLFLKKTVELDLYEVFSDTKLPQTEKDIRVGKVIEFCKLSNLLKRHPYDLSGGEQQRVALAKVLLTNPDILLLDEPTKGLDTHYKEKLAKILKGLLKNGVTILMVSHDVEFCARYADRCGMFFDGIVTSEDIPRRFFSEKTFYTTAANRMSRGIVKDAILDEDIVLAIGGKMKKSEVADELYVKQSTVESAKKAKPKIRNKLLLKNFVVGSVFAVLFILMQLALRGRNGVDSCVIMIAGIICLGISLSKLLPRKEIGKDNALLKTNKKPLSKHMILSCAVILVLIPLTVFAGVWLLDNRKYYFISMLIIFEVMIPFFMAFEGRKPKSEEVVVISVLCALAIVGRIAFAALPQFKPVAAVVIITGVCLGGESGFLVGAVTGFVSNFFFGQSPYTPWQMFAFGIIGFLAGLLFDKGLLKKSKTVLCVFGFVATLVIYGGIMNPAAVIISQPTTTWEMILSAFVMGFPFDMVHAVSTAFFLYIATEPMIEKLNRIKIKYGIAEMKKTK